MFSIISQNSHLSKISYVTDLFPLLEVLDVSATIQMHSNSSMLALAEVSGHSPMHASRGGKVAPSAWSWGLRRY